MNGIEATYKLSGLKKRFSALSNVIYYLSGDRDYAEDVDILNEIKNEVHTEIESLEDRLRAVNL